MKRKVGLWIDHRKAVIVFLTGEEEEIKLVKSNVEKHIRPSVVLSDDSQQREFTEHLNIYHNEVISCIRDAESILIFGPGESKGEFKKHLEREGLGGRIVGIETTDKMTDPQIAAKVRQYFLNQK